MPDLERQPQSDLRRQMVVAVGLNLEVVQTAIPDAVICGDIQDVLALLVSNVVQVLLLGPGVSAVATRHILTICCEPSYQELPAIIVLGIRSDDLQGFQEFVDVGRIFYLTTGPISGEQLSRISRAAIRHLEIRKAATSDLDTAADRAALADLCIRLGMQPDLRSLADLTVQAVQERLPGCHAQCLLFSADDAALSFLNTSAKSDDTFSAATGLSGFACLTGERILVEHADHDPRYDVEIDNPRNMVDPRLAAEIIFGVTGYTVGLITAVRHGSAASFSSEELRFLRSLAGSAAAAFNHLLTQQRAESLVADNAQHLGMGIFREEALRHHTQRGEPTGKIIRRLPPWLQRSFWFVVGFFIVASVLVGSWVMNVMRESVAK